MQHTSHLRQGAGTFRVGDWGGGDAHRRVGTGKASRRGASRATDEVAEGGSHTGRLQRRHGQRAPSSQRSGNLPVWARRSAITR